MNAFIYRKTDKKNKQGIEIISPKMNALHVSARAQTSEVQLTRQHEQAQQYVIQYHEQRMIQLELERQLAYLQRENEDTNKKVTRQRAENDSLKKKLERKRAHDKSKWCPTCDVLPAQVDALLQSLTGICANVFTIFTDANVKDNFSRQELVNMMLEYIDPVKHLDPRLEELFEKLSNLDFIE